MKKIIVIFIFQFLYFNSIYAQYAIENDYKNYNNDSLICNLELLNIPQLDSLTKKITSKKISYAYCDIIKDITIHVNGQDTLLCLNKAHVESLIKEKDKKDKKDWLIFLGLVHQIGHIIYDYDVDNGVWSGYQEIIIDRFSGHWLYEIGTDNNELMESIIDHYYYSQTIPYHTFNTSLIISQDPDIRDRYQAMREGWYRAERLSKKIEVTISENKAYEILERAKINTTSNFFDRIELCNQSITIYPTVEAYAVRALLKTQMGLFTMVDQDLKEAIKMKKEEPSLRLILIFNKYYHLGKTTEALSEVQNLIKEYPIKFAYYENAFKMFKNSEAYDIAIEFIKSCIGKYNLNESFLYQYMGLFYLETNRLDEALNSFDVSIKKDSTNTQAYINRGYLFQTHQEYALAERDYKIALKISPTDNQLYINYGSLLYELGRNKEAVDLYTKGLEKMPDAYNLYLLRGQTLLLSDTLTLGNAFKAEKDFWEVIKHYPKTAEAYFGLGFIESKFANFSKAIEYFSEAIYLNSHTIDASWYVFRAEAYYALGKYEEAIHDIEISFLYTKNDPMAYYIRGLILAKLERWAEAIEAFDKCLSLDPSDEQAIQQLYNAKKAVE